MLFRSVSLADRCRDLAEEDFSSPFLGKVYRLLLEGRAQGGGMSLTALSGACTAEEMSHLTTLLQKPESLANADKSLPDYIRVIKESAGRRRGETPADPLLAAQDRFKEKKGYGGKQT